MSDRSHILPSCTTREVRQSIVSGDHTFVPLYCGSCGVMGGHVIRERCNFAFWLCNDCSERWSPQVGVMMVPDEVVWAQMALESQDAQGNPFSAEKVNELVRDGNSPLAKLIRDLPSHD